MLEDLVLIATWVAAFEIFGLLELKQEYMQREQDFNGSRVAKLITFEQKNRVSPKLTLFLVTIKQTIVHNFKIFGRGIHKILKIRLIYGSKSLQMHLLHRKNGL